MASVSFQLWGVYRPTPPPAEPDFPLFDKVAHVTAFGLPVLLVSLALARTVQWPVRRVLLVVAGVSAVHAVLSELIQGAFYAHRSGDPFDVLADLVGIGLGATVAALTLNQLARRGRRSP